MDGSTVGSVIITVSPNQTFTRLQLPDPQTNQALQDVYNKLAQVQFNLSSLQDSLTSLSKQVSSSTPTSSAPSQSPTWVTIPPQSAWSSAGPVNNYTAAAALVGNFVYLCGTLQTASFAIGQAATLPQSSMYPKYPVEVVIDVLDQNTGLYYPGQVVITAAGAISFQVTVVAGHGALVFLDGVSYRVR